MTRKRHLTVGWCWEYGEDSDPAEYGIYGHVTDAEAIAIVEAYAGDPPGSITPDQCTITRSWGRTVPCRRLDCGCDTGSHLEMTDKPGRGASPFTWIDVELPF